MTAFLRDLLLGIRSLRRNPGFTIVAVLTLALGIGANSAIFTLVNATMLRPLPYPDPGSLAHVSLTAAGKMKDLAGREKLPWSYPKIEKFRSINSSLQDIAAFQGDYANLTGAGTPHRVRLAYASSPYFRLLGAKLVRGRAFSEADDAIGSPLAGLLSEGLWRRAFGSDPGIVGRTASLNLQPVTVVGVVSGSFTDLAGNTEIWVPVSAAPRLMYPEALSEAGNHWLEVVGRRKPGVTPSRLEAEVTANGAAIARAFPVPARFDDGSTWGASSESLAASRSDRLLRRSLLILLGAVGCVLLIACVNISHLVLARNAARSRELAVRTSLGASRRQLLRPLLAESALIAAAGTAAGLLGALFITRLLAAGGPDRLLRWGVASTELVGQGALAPDARVLIFTILLAVPATLLFGIIPALRATSVSPGLILRGAGPQSRGRATWRGLRLIAVQASVASLLIVAAGLLTRSLAALTRVNLGFSTARLVSVELQPAEGAYTDAGAIAMHARLIERALAIPGVVSAAVDNSTPLTDNFSATRVKRLDGREVPRDSQTRVDCHLVSTDYFRTLSISLLAGRVFTSADRKGSPRVAIVNAAAARRLWPDGHPLGRHLAMGMGDFEGNDSAEVVGVVADTRLRQPGLPGDPGVYLPDLQSGWPMTTLFVRTQTSDPATIAPAIRAAIASIDPALPTDNMSTMEEHAETATSGARFAALLLSLFALLALALSAIGIYGVCAEAISNRTREIGVRLALGASPGAIRSFVRMHAIGAAAMGAAFGLGAAFAATRLMKALLFDVTTTDPAAFLAAPLLLAAACLAAGERPARRAARVDPMVALRSE